MVESKLPKAMIAIDKIAVRLGIPLPDAIELVKLAEADGLLTTWSDTYCFLSQAEAKERGLVLVSTPDRGEASPNEWYWVHSQGEDANSDDHGDIHPWSISLEMLPGSRRNRMWCRERSSSARHEHELGPSCKCFSDLASDLRIQSMTRIASAGTYWIGTSSQIHGPHLIRWKRIDVASDSWKWLNGTATSETDGCHREDAIGKGGRSRIGRSIARR